MPPFEAAADAAATEDRTVAIFSYITIIGFLAAIFRHQSHKSRLGAFHLRPSLTLTPERRQHNQDREADMTVITSKWLPIFTVILASACGEKGGMAAQHSSAAGAEAAAFCPSAADVSETAGFTVQVLAEGTRSYGPAQMCAYQATTQAGVFVSISVAPANPDSDPLAEVRSAARTFLGSRADAERIAVGDSGYAYGSDPKSEAAARKGERVFRVDITSTGDGIGNKKAAVIALLRQVVK